MRKILAVFSSSFPQVQLFDDSMHSLFYLRSVMVENRKFERVRKKKEGIRTPAALHLLRSVLLFECSQER